ncbi:hypothetical protein DERP_001266 [Dermatophagoides pteronyssinus]|uniref:Uncharacterized protein n=1 Tax=Dermatophagoides pteronyssinus TaxID=6956 RepID=A0ABQ8JEQ0_DERPT|nr:hypothetical protein DERP_001266 [Dermatophagoides pteronyssinus]
MYNCDDDKLNKTDQIDIRSNMIRYKTTPVSSSSSSTTKTMMNDDGSNNGFTLRSNEIFQMQYFSPFQPYG